jgi:tetratricopeptide (TPR) repeat protein
MITPKQSPRLESWKEIAGYLARTVRTVQRWEETEGLPVHRHLHQALGNIYAYPAELDEWIANRHAQPSPPEPIAPKSRRWMIVTAVAAVVLAAAGGAWLVSRAMRPSEPVWLLVTALDNRTGEPLLDESVPFLLEREISNSSGVYVAPRARVEDSLRLMRKDPNTRVGEALGRDVAIRDGGIRLVVSSRAERTGSAYLMTASVIDSASGRLIGSASEQAKTITEIAQAVHRLAATIRRASGDRGAGGAANQPELEHVATPSLLACRLYSQAYRLGTQMGSLSDWEDSERLAREAIAEDPQFASAHIWLAYALRNQDKPEAEWRPSLARAVEFSNSATDRERQFILASQKTMDKDWEGAVLAYRRMLASYPDDYWAWDNLRDALMRLDRGREATRELWRLADLRPNDRTTLTVAVRESIFEGDFAHTRQYIAQLRRIINGDGDENALNLSLFIDRFPLHEKWVAGQLDPLRADVDQMARRPVADPRRKGSPVSWYQTLGRLRDAEAYVAQTPSPPWEQREILIGYLRDDPAEFRRRLENVRPDWAIMTWMLLRASQRPDEVQTLLESEILRGLPRWFTLLIECRAAAIRGDPAAAEAMLKEVIHTVPEWEVTIDQYFIARSSVARAYEQAGDEAAALRMLKDADLGRAPLFSGGRPGGAFWHRIRYDEARLLRKLGRQKEAEPIEAGLRRDLRLADPDHPILVRLNERERRPFNVY